MKGGGTGNWNHGFRSFDDGTHWLMAHNGDFYAAGNIIAYWSDRRLKEDIEKITDWKEILAGVNGYRFKWNEIGKKLHSTNEQETMVGLIAQEVAAVLPQAADIQMLQYKERLSDGTMVPKDDINYDPENPYLTVKEEKFIPVLIEALKSHDITIDDLQERIRKLENIINMMSE